MNIDEVESGKGLRFLPSGNVVAIKERGRKVIGVQLNEYTK